MKWITDFLHLPMTWDVIIPVILLMFFAMFLVWESRLPPEKKIFRKLWKQRTPAIVKKNAPVGKYDKTIE
jgi:hypothetical protein